MSAKSMLPAISPDGNLSRYLEQIRAFPMLEPVSYTHLTLPTILRV